MLIILNACFFSTFALISVANNVEAYTVASCNPHILISNIKYVIKYKIKLEPVRLYIKIPFNNYIYCIR